MSLPMDVYLTGEEGEEKEGDSVATLGGFILETMEEAVGKGDSEADTYCLIESSLVLVTKVYDW